MDIEKQLYSSGQVMADEEMEEVLSLQNVKPKKKARVLRWRDGWLKFLPAFIVFYSFIKEIKVGEPFLFKYQTEVLNLTSEQIKSEIYPFNPYAYLISLIPIFLLTDFLLYKPTMLVEILGQIGFRASLVFFKSVFSQIVGIIVYGMASASEIGFFSYVYARLEKDEYRRLTSWTRAGTMCGRTLGYGLSQLIILTHLGNYYTLNVIAFIMPCIVLIFCICMPSVSWKRMAARIEESRVERALAKQTTVENIPMPQSYGQYLHQRITTLHTDFKQIYSSAVVRRWSFYWAMGTSLSLQFALLSQTLWGEIQP
ncbi:Folate-like transporter 2 [Aphelenchoides bicaudatus]|nr:Folate-like transporter 2 [Aphelenchoides bicaudatus]